MTPLERCWAAALCYGAADTGAAQRKELIDMEVED